MHGAFASDDFIVCLHYSSSRHHTVKRKWPETSSFFGGEIIRSAVPGLRIDFTAGN